MSARTLVAMTDTATDLDAARRAAIEHLWKTLADGDAAATAHEIYHDDAVLEFPQSGERFEGRANFQAWRELYPEPVQVPGPPNHGERIRVGLGGVRQL